MRRPFSVASSIAAGGLIFYALASSLAAQLAPRPTRPHVTPPQGAARQVIFKYCTSCHGIDDYAYNALDRAAWDEYLTKKHRGMDVPFPADSRAVLLDWLASASARRPNRSRAPTWPGKRPRSSPTRKPKRW